MSKTLTLKLGLPAELVNYETNERLKVFAPYTVFDFAVFNKEINEGVTVFSNNRYPHKVVYGKLGAKFGGLVT